LSSTTLGKEGFAEFLALGKGGHSAKTIYAEREVEADEDEDKVGGFTSSGTSSVYLRGAATYLRDRILFNA